jgi:hypothetical protein
MPSIGSVKQKGSRPLYLPGRDEGDGGLLQL